MSERAIILTPGRYVMTERKGRFYAVGVVSFGPKAHGITRDARCCEEGHPTPDGVDECWQQQIRLDGSIDGRPRARSGGDLT